ncbi:Patatin-like phospholipase [Aquimixticola soesokkakensis]|uniref:Patatin-like phospholipase n=1 Tax=Aquimixticola soesokkakensis TaxID=1519096 RepID=A0A1Y5SJ52_9RHOB|nr:patatin-like phospholipase family protein [Aquimixticola soesokkakensis]SLN40831.1 Patatin-like phospholipase [Aquimixticola soesokkakensis]
MDRPLTPTGGAAPPKPAKRRAKPAVKSINLALQGGGAHGAYTWGVLDRLLDEERVEIAAISGTSAGALNGFALKMGLAQSRDHARENLNWLWRQMGAITDMRMANWLTHFGPATAQVARAVELAFAQPLMEMMSNAVSPYAYGPFYENPLERIVRKFDFSQVGDCGGPRLMISATNVRTGKIRVFEDAEITDDVVLASACLPTVFQGVKITDPKTGVEDVFWDGGFTGNPALFPLYATDLPEDILIVNINPLERKEMPLSPMEIANRVNEISFNSSLLRELRAAEFVQRLIAQGRMPEGAMKNVHVHMVSDDRLMNELSATTKLIPTPILLSRLFDAGRVAADRFLEDHFDDLNERGTIDLKEMFS